MHTCIQLCKESTSLVVAFKEFGIALSYTLEASFMGACAGAAANAHFRSQDLEDLGHDWCRALLDLRDAVADTRRVHALVDYAEAELTSAAAAAADRGSDSGNSSDDEVVANPQLDHSAAMGGWDLAWRGGRRGRVGEEEDREVFSNFLKKSSAKKAKRRPVRSTRQKVLTKPSVADVLKGALSRANQHRRVEDEAIAPAPGGSPRRAACRGDTRAGPIHSLSPSRCCFVEHYCILMYSLCVCLCVCACV